jgi:hypothetical protein
MYGGKVFVLAYVALGFVLAVAVSSAIDGAPGFVAGIVVLAVSLGASVATVKRLGWDSPPD